jgi:hypothetical protein
MYVSIDEQETVIQYNRNSKTCTVWTSDSTVMCKLDKLVNAENSAEWKIIKVDTIDGELFAKKYEANKRLISFRSCIVKRTMTAEQKQATAERLATGRAKKRILS